MGKICIVILICITSQSYSQNIIYSDPEAENIFTLNNYIIGEMKGNLLIYKSDSLKSSILVYDNNMKLKNNVPLDFISKANLLTIAFIKTVDGCYLLYQVAENEKVYYKVGAFNENGKLSEAIRIIDSTETSTINESILYNFIQSENKEYTLLNRMISGLEPKELRVDQIVLDAKCNIKKNEHYFIPFFDNENISNPVIDNEGSICFVKFKNPLNTNKGHIAFYKLKKISPDLEIKEFEIKDAIFENPIIKIDKSNNIYHIVSLYRKQLSNTNTGIAILKIGADASKDISPLLYPFHQTVTKSDNKTKNSLNNYYTLKDFIINSDGNVAALLSILNVDLNKATFRENSVPYNVMRTKSERVNLNGYVEIDKQIYYQMSPEENPYSPFTRSYDYRVIKHNLVIYSFDKNNHLSNFSTLDKDLIEQNSIPFYLKINLEKQPVFIYTDKKNIRHLRNFTLQNDGTIMANPMFKNLNLGYKFYLDLGKQIDATTLIIPCEKNGKLSFAKIEFK